MTPRAPPSALASPTKRHERFHSLPCRVGHANYPIREKRREPAAQHQGGVGAIAERHPVMCPGPRFFSSPKQLSAAAPIHIVEAFPDDTLHERIVGEVTHQLLIENLPAPFHQE